MKRLLENVATGVLVVCALTITGLLVRRELGFGSGPAKPTNVSDWVEYGSSAKWIGPRSAPVRVVEFADFQCPFCAENASTLKTLMAKYPGKIAVIYRSYPLTRIHPEAYRAALAAECAADQGAFEKFHDLVYLKQDSIGIIPWRDFAVRSGIGDSERFNKCLQQQHGRTRVHNDSLAGAALKISGTPTLLVNNLLLPSGSPNQADLEKIVQTKLRR